MFRNFIQLGTGTGEEPTPHQTDMTPQQCCGSERFFFIFGFINFCLPDSYSKANILTRQFSKQWLSMLSYCMYLEDCESEKKSFAIEKAYIFSELFLFLYQYLDRNMYPNPKTFLNRIWIRPKPSDSFGFGSFHTTAPQHW
jgi:hypothetical protein